MKINMKAIKILPAVIAVMGFMFMACEREKVTPDNNSPQAKNAMKVELTDSPGDYEELEMEIVGVDAYLEGSGWVELSGETRTVNVLDLTNGQTAEIAYSGDMEAGAYTMLRVRFGDENRLYVDENLSVIAGGINIGGSLMFDLTWEGEHEVVVEVDEQMEAGTQAGILLDFDVAGSVYDNGQEYVINPVVNLIEDASTGVQGRIEGAGSAAILLKNGANTISTYTNAQGQFLLRGAKEGTYELIAMPKMDDQYTGTQDEVHLQGVAVVQGQITQVGTIRF